MVSCKRSLTFDPARGAATRTIPQFSFDGSSSARIIHPQVPIAVPRKKKWRSLPLSKAILQGTAPST